MAELTERSKQVAEEIHKEVCAVNRQADEMPYISIYKMYRDPSVNISVGRFDISGDNIEGLLDAVHAHEPVNAKALEIAELEAKLAALKGGAK